MLLSLVCIQGCDYATVNHLNQYHLHPLVSELVTLPFFRYFKVRCQIPPSAVLVLIPVPEDATFTCMIFIYSAQFSGRPQLIKDTVLEWSL